MKIALAGLQRELMEKTIKSFGNEGIQTVITTDMNGCSMIKKGEVDYYFGACNTGAGAAISIAIGLLGYGKCCTIAKPGMGAKVHEVEKFVKDGKIAFGMSIENIEQAIPILLNQLLKEEK